MSIQHGQHLNRRNALAPSVDLAVPQVVPVDYIWFTDGAVRDNPGPGGAGFWGGTADGQQRIARAYGMSHTTNSRAELWAAILALSITPMGASIQLRVDSEYVKHSIERLPRFAADGWKRRSRKGAKRLANVDLLQHLHALCQARTVQVVWVKGHAGIEGNAWADELADIGCRWGANSAEVQAVREDRPVLYPGSLPTTLPLTASFIPMGLEGTIPTGSSPTPAEMAAEAFLARRSAFRTAARGYGRLRCTAPSGPANRARTRPEIDLHLGTCFDWRFRYERAALQAGHELMRGCTSPETDQFFSELFRYATDYRALKLGFEISKRHGSLAKGVDGITFEDYGHADEVALLRTLSASLRDGTWQPSSLRRVWVPKGNGRGQRPIDIPTVADRVVETALNVILAPILHWLLPDTCVGFRPCMGLHHGLAQALHLAGRGQTTWAALDIRSAFTGVPKNRLIDLVRKYVPNHQLVELLGKTISRPLPAGRGISAHRGLPQGSPLSPALLNLYLAVLLDHPWRKEHPDTQLIRYADDLLLTGNSSEQIASATEHIRQRLNPHGLALREEPPVIANLAAGESLEVLGYEIRGTPTGIRILVPPTAWNERLVEARLLRGNAETSWAVFRGWVDHAGPAYPGRGLEHAQERQTLIGLLLDLAREMELIPAPPADEVHRIWRDAFDRWEALYRSVTSPFQTACINGLRLAPHAPHRGSQTEGWTAAVRQVNAAIGTSAMAEVVITGASADVAAEAPAAGPQAPVSSEVVHDQLGVRV